MSRREVPSSSIASIVDFLMFFNNGKKCDVNNAVIEKYKSEMDLSEHPEYISKRYSDFYLVSINVVRKTQWTSEDFVELLDIFMEMESKYGSKGTQNSMLKRKDQWKKIKIKTVFQMGLCVLRDTLGLDDDVPTKPNKFKLPIEFDIASYSNDIFELYDREKQHFITSEREDVLEDFERQKNILTEDLYCEAPRKKAGGGRPSSKRTSFVRQLNKDRVFALLDENRITNWIPEVIEFIQLIEEKTLPIPMDVGKYGEGPTCDLNKLLQQQKDGGCVSAGKTRERSVPVSAQKAHLKEQARVPEEEEQVDPDWGDDQADASGPYDPPRANKKRLSLSSPNSRPLKVTKPSSPEVPISPILPDKQRSATRHSGAQFKQTNDEFVDKYGACDPLNDIQDVGKPSSSSSSGTARNPALAKVSRQRLSAVMKKPVQSNRVPSKIDFDSVAEDDIENSDSDKEADNTDRKAVRTLLNLKQELPKTEFPSTLLSPLSFNSSGKKTRKRDRDLASVRKFRRVIWTLEEEEALQDGVEIHGEGFWSAIRDDPKYREIFNNRSNVNLKDKWRNMVKKGNRQATGTGNETHDNNEE